MKVNKKKSSFIHTIAQNAAENDIPVVEFLEKVGYWQLFVNDDDEKAYVQKMTSDSDKDDVLQLNKLVCPGSKNRIAKNRANYDIFMRFAKSHIRSLSGDENLDIYHLAGYIYHMLYKKIVDTPKMVSNETKSVYSEFRKWDKIATDEKFIEWREIQIVGKKSIKAIRSSLSTSSCSFIPTVSLSHHQEVTSPYSGPH